MMAAAENGTESSTDLDIEALINVEVDEKDVSEVVSSLHKELKAAQESTLSSSQDSVVDPVERTSKLQLSENGSQNAGSDVIDLTKPIKTEGEPSSTAQTTTNPPTTQSPTTPNPKPGSLTLEGLHNASTVAATRPGFMSPLSGLFPTAAQLQLTSDEHSYFYKQASLVAIHALSSKHGPAKAKDILAVVTKVREFLTNLITLAGNSGVQVRVAVQSLVQKLVAGNITEEEFAKKIEEDLKSKHQPGLLPFLKQSVPHLRLHLQLQQSVLKQLLEKRVQQQQQQQSPILPSPQQQTQQPPQTQQPQQTQQQTQQLHEPSQPSKTAPVPTAQPQAAAAAASLLASTVAQSAAQQQPQSQQLPQQSADVAAALAKLHKTKLLQVALLQQQQQQQQQQQKKGPVSLANGPSPQGVSPASAANPFSVLFKQQQRVKEQQQQASQALGLQAVAGQVHLGNLPVAAGAATAAGIATTPAAGAATATAPGVSGRGIDIQVTQPGPSGANKTVYQAKSKGLPRENSQSPLPSSKGDDDDDEDSMDIAGINLREETAHFLPSPAVEVTASCQDQTFLSLTSMREKVLPIVRRHGIADVSEDFLTLLSHATEERLRNVVEKLTVICTHRVDNLKDNSQYEATTDVRGQLKVLESIDKIIDSRRQEKEKEKILKAATSRSKQDNPELAKKKEQAKQLKLAQEREIHTRAANVTALAAIGRRKRPASAALGGDNSSQSSLPNGGVGEGVGGSSASSSSLAAAMFSTPVSPMETHRICETTVRTKQKRRILPKDVVFLMEQEKETRTSQLLYKSFLK